MRIGRSHETLVLVVSVAVLCVTGLLMIYSATMVTAGRSEGYGFDAAYFLKRQVLFLVAGTVIAFFLSRQDYYRIREWIWPIMGVTFLLLFLVFVPGVGRSVKGACRWVKAGPVQFQPSEVAKFVLVAFGAYWIERMNEKERVRILPWLKPLLVVCLFVAPVLRQPDFGMSVVILSSFACLAFLAGIDWKAIAAAFAAAPVAGWAMVMAKGYRKARIEAFLDPFTNLQGSGWQVVQSLVAFSNGGIFGTGLGAGTQKLYYLPEMHTDYIFALVGEEFGFVGVVVLASVYGVIAAVGFRIAYRARELFGRYLAAGIASVIGVQALFNMGVGLHLLPPKGMVLPFLSYGGTSLVIHLAAVGILVSISVRGGAFVAGEDDDRGGRDRWARFSWDRPR